MPEARKPLTVPTKEEVGRWPHEKLVHELRQYAKAATIAQEELRQYRDQGLSDEILMRLANVDRLERDNRDLSGQLARMRARALAAEAALKAAGIAVATAASEGRHHASAGRPMTQKHQLDQADA